MDSEKHFGRRVNQLTLLVCVIFFTFFQSAIFKFLFIISMAENNHFSDMLCTNERFQLSNFFSLKTIFRVR